MTHFLRITAATAGIILGTLLLFSAAGITRMADRYTELRSKLPSSYVEFIAAHNGWEGDLGEEFGYVVIWNRETIQERWDGYEIGRYLSERWFPFGSNGGGEMLCFDLPSGSDRVFWVPYIGMSDEEAMPRYDSFAEVAAAVLKDQ